MPAPARVRPARPRIWSGDLPTGTVASFTFTRELAIEWLGCSEAEMDDLVRRSQLNASRGLLGPLELVNEGRSFTLRSVFNCRRLLAASLH